MADYQAIIEYPLKLTLLLPDSFDVNNERHMHNTHLSLAACKRTLVECSDLAEPHQFRWLKLLIGMHGMLFRCWFARYASWPCACCSMQSSNVFSLIRSFFCVDVVNFRGRFGSFWIKDVLNLHVRGT